jgi:riboflavin transporter FmnP
LNARLYALISVFAALAIILNIVRIPIFYWPGFFYTICEIPVLVAFLIYGFKLGFLVEAIHIMGQEIFFPVGLGGIVVYPMGFFIHLFMFSGIYFANKLVNRKVSSGKPFSEKRKSFYFTIFATAFRGGLMPIVDSTILYGIFLPLVLGTVISETYILGLLPSFVLYNITSTLYTVPVAYLIAKKASNYLKIQAKFLIPDLVYPFSSKDI